jgi:phosphoribosylaminoimidazole-succinocarboxamide synthase
VREAIWTTDLAGLPPPRRGKVRDVYDLGETLLLVATDRLSAYDHVLRPAIPGKGKVLTQLSSFWFARLGRRFEGRAGGEGVANHLLATDPADFPAAVRPYAAQLKGRAVLVRKTAVVPFECVARGYLAGSGFREYRQGGSVCGIELPPGLALASRLPRPIFTPATKAAHGHDENVAYETFAAGVMGATGAGAALPERLRRLTLTLYELAAAHAAACGLILADTKFEFGLLPAGSGGPPGGDAAGEAAGEGVAGSGDVADRLLLIDEALTPDSSRYWDAAHWRPGEEPASFDKQFVRNWLDASGWDHQSPPPELPRDVVLGTVDRYVEAYRRLTGSEPDL